MKRFLLLATLGLILFSCSNDSGTEIKKEEASSFGDTQTPQELATESALTNLYNQYEGVQNPHEGDTEIKETSAKEGDVACANKAEYHGYGIWTQDVVMFHKGQWHFGVVTTSNRGEEFYSIDSGGSLFKLFMCCCSGMF